MPDAAVTSPAGERWVRRGLAALLLLTAAAYVPVLSNGFVYDDLQYLEENPLFSRGPSLSTVPAAFAHLYAGNWHPLTWLSHAADLAVFGSRPAGHHAVNLALHLVNVLLVFRFLTSLAGARGPALLVAALFALHPLNVETVAWVAERKNLLSTLFGLLALLAYLSAGRGGGRGRLVPVFLLMAVSLLCKPMLVTLPAILLALDFWPLRRFAGWRTVAEKVPFLALSAASSAVTILAQGTGLPGFAEFPLWTRAANAVLSGGRYLLHAAFPVGLAAYYPHPRTEVPWAGVAASAAVLAVALVFAWRWRRTRPWLAFGLAFYLVTLAPVIGMVQTGGQALADRYAYVPLLGIFAAAAFALGALRGRARRVATVSAGILLPLLAALTFRQAGVWRDAETLFSHAIAHTGDNAVAQYNLGRAIEEAGRNEEAIPHYREAIRIDPDYGPPHVNLGTLLDRADRHEEAMVLLGRATRLMPGSPQPHYNIGLSLLRRGRHGDALPYLLRARDLSPGDPRAPLQIAVAWLGLGRPADAVACLEAALKDTEWGPLEYMLGRALVDLGRPEEAARRFRRAIDLDPDPANPARAALQALEGPTPAGR